ncbi:hypothetical protein [Chroococcidiopsis sp. CCMEE 29]|uniref:hypothetical protein n=1 Tax=Chroococcidiopsis sp. CCMEE 29 TaxID=155894 RepID=UPI00202050D0|nr:hypothetical protein [Chroococcidiopsis sp. CCMEE 29]
MELGICRSGVVESLRDPMMHSWSEQDQPLQLLEKTADKTETDPKAMACYGVYSRSHSQMLLRFVEQRPGARDYL